MLVRASIILTLWWYAVEAKIYQRCELARELKKLAVPHQEIATWVCIAQHESLFDTEAMNMGSGDHGLFQISEIYWCSPPGYGCNKPCAAFRDDDISDDIECIRRIYNEHQLLSGDGWNAWVVYPLYCKGDVGHYVQNCDLESVNVTSNEIPSGDANENWVDQYGDGYQFPSLPSFNKKSESVQSNEVTSGDGYMFPPLPNFSKKDSYGDGYEFPPLHVLKEDDSKDVFNNYKEDFEKFKDDYQFAQPELELPKKLNKYNDTYRFPPLPTFASRPKSQETVKNIGDFESGTKSIKVQKFASKSTRRAESTTKSVLENRFSNLGETTTRDLLESTTTPKPFTFKLFSLKPFILNGQAVSVNGETVTLKPVDSSDINLSESVKSYFTTHKPNTFVQSFTTPKTTTPELISVESIESSTNQPKALALQSLSQTKSKITTERYRTWKPKIKSTKLYSSKFRTTKAPSTTEKTFIINTISAFVPKSSRKQYSTPSGFKVTTFRPFITTSLSTMTNSVEVSSEETPPSTLKVALSTFEPSTSSTTVHPSYVSASVSNETNEYQPLGSSTSNSDNGTLSSTFSSSTLKPFSFSTFGPLPDIYNVSLRQVTFPPYFPSWFQTLPPVLAPLPPLPTVRPSSRKPWGSLATRPTRRTTTSRPIRPLRPLFNQVTYKPPEAQTDTPLLRDIIFKQSTDANSLFGSKDDGVETSMHFYQSNAKESQTNSKFIESDRQDTSDFLSDIFDIESRVTPEEELEEIILEPDYSFYRTKNGYRLFRRRAPILISFPHLLYGDHRYISGVDGLHPRQSSHETLVILEKVSGIPLKLSKRVQFNMFIRNIEGVEAFENITNCLVPIFWIEEEMALPQQFLEKLSTLYKFLNIFEIVKYVLIAFSCSLIVTSVGLFIYSK